MGMDDGARLGSMRVFDNRGVGPDSLGTDNLGMDIFGVFGVYDMVGMIMSLDI